MYTGSTGPGWKDVLKKVANPMKTKYKIITRNSLFSLGMILLTGFCVLAPTSGFMAHDCMNSSNSVEVYPLPVPEGCHVTGGEHKVEHFVQAELCV
jgi:hypothetical protein